MNLQNIISSDFRLADNRLFSFISSVDKRILAIASIAFAFLVMGFIWLRQKTAIGINVFLSPQPCSPESVVKKVMSIKEPIDIYCWYEGPRGLPDSGARFMKESLFEPLYKQKKSAKLYLYSLRAWDFCYKKRMEVSNPLGEAINKIDKTAVECLYSSSFFQFCKESSKETPLYQFFNTELPKKEWLKKISEKEKPLNKTVADIFNQTSSLFDCIGQMDASLAYSFMQYVEGYYLVKESVRKGLENNQKEINIAFILPNDEGKYYRDFPQEIQKLLRLDFGEKIARIKISIQFQFFFYKPEESLKARPYIDKSSKPIQVKPQNIASYFDYLNKEKSK